MKILHTSDWHLGKYLEGESRLDEQEEFLKDLITLSKEEDTQLIIIAGDIFDTSNPPARAEKLFFKSLKALSRDGRCVILIIGGNHDSAERIVTSTPLATEQGIILLGKPSDTVEVGRVGIHEIVDSGEGFLELSIDGENAVILTLPYPSEQRLGEILNRGGDEEERRVSYSKRVGEIFSRGEKKFREDTINLATSHLFVLGGEVTDSERPIQIGGGLTVESRNLPETAQYVALGHLHRAQRVGGRENAYYAGSPLQYSKSEASHRKYVYLVDVLAGRDAEVTRRELRNYKPIEVWKCDSFIEAKKKCIENKDKDMWVYLEVKTDRVITNSEIKTLKDIKSDILSITPIIEGEECEEFETDMTDKSIVDLFKEFYVTENGVEATDDLLEIFKEIISEGGEDDEA